MPTELSTEEEYDKAFDEADLEGVKPGEKPDGDEPKGDEPGDNADDIETSYGDDPNSNNDNPDNPKPDEGESPKTLTPEQWEQKFKSFEGRIKVREDQWEEERSQWERERDEMRQQIDTLKPRPEKPEGETQDTDTGPEFDEAAFADEYGEDVLKAVKYFAKQVATDTVDSKVKPLEEKLTPMEQRQKEIEEDARAAASKRFYEAVRSGGDGHDDFDDYIPGGKLNGDLIEWIDSQTSYLAKAYKNVYEAGTAEETKDLLTRYKQARGMTSNKDEPPPTPPDTSNLETVTSRRTPPSRGRASKDDFDGAWDEAERIEGRR
ncbi:MAG: hypothetical protein PVI97_19890 [Candidatus Thiodiazotropha sp.]|jgi:hypothetical protein